eukprot:TRINITY_DN603_c0_g1_i1.p1 TRINITY_DN603_c0_g1~~TRINITY_DN603_c0_g1_i1.p1  ORF type:complete len:336 (-),score=56.74 TRINITY_DN603_c0_g1_i1:247-1254(-)
MLFLNYNWLSFIVYCCCCCLALFATHTVTVVAAVNNRPTIGILTQPTTDLRAKYGDSFIPMNYEQWVTQGGARVVPINFRLPFPELKKLWQSVNGVLFMGGATSLKRTGQYEQAAEYLYNLTVEAYSHGDYFPMWGTCLGFELVQIMQSLDENILSSLEAENISLALNLTTEAKHSRLLGSAPSDIYHMFDTEKITMHRHIYGVSPATFSRTKKLTDFFNILATNVAVAGPGVGQTFISVIEGKQVPIYATQWHPERNQFDFTLPYEDLNHSYHAIQAMQYLSSFFVNECKRNNHAFASEEEEARALIYNVVPPKSTRDFEPGSQYSMIYFFQKP